MQNNKYGLSRHIPAGVAREVRQRSRFGCVLCRCGFVEYEHIDPSFEHAHTHDPARICCLCSSCHAAVTRGQRSKASVAHAYEAIQAKTLGEAGVPIGPLDFHGGKAELSIGGLRYSPLVNTVLRYDGEDVIKVVPGDRDTPGTISATFTDEAGNPVLRLIENAWEGSTANWDIEVVGPRITVRNEAGGIPLKLRLDPPGVIVIERLDMRVGSGHLLVSESGYAAGRYLDDGSIAWLYVQLSIAKTTEAAAAIEFANPETLFARDETTQAKSNRMVAMEGRLVTSSGAGCMWIPAGIAIASLCGGFALNVLAVGIRPLEGVRRMVIRDPRVLSHYLATGEET